MISYISSGRKKWWDGHATILISSGVWKSESVFFVPGYADLNEWRNLTGGIDLARGGDGAVVIAEFEPRANSGRTICIGSGCYDWYGKGVDASADYYHYNVEQMTLNAINYLCK